MEPQDSQPAGPNDATLVAPRAQQGSARLILRKPDGQLKEYGLDKDEITIGRLSTNDVVLADDRSVSRRHAVIRRSNVGYVIEDQQSNNGTYVDGEKILYPFVLHNGQSIKIGANELTFRLVSTAIQPVAQEPAAPAGAPAPGATLPSPEAQPRAANATPPDQFVSQPAPQQPIPQPGFAASLQPGFNTPQQPAFASPPQPAPAFPAQPAPALPQQPAPGIAGQQSFLPGPGEIICQQCGQPTLANKQFCLQCGANIAFQLAQQGRGSGPAAFGTPGPAPGFFPPNQANPASGPAGGSAPAINQPGWPQQAPAWSPPQPSQPGWQQQPQGWPGQPGQFGAPAPAAGPIDATVLFPKSMRLMQPGEVRVRLFAQFAGPFQPGTPITVRVWSAPQDAFYLSTPAGIALRIPAPGNVEEGVLQVTPIRQAAPGSPYQLFFMVTDAGGQPLHPQPVAAEIMLTDQPVSPFENQGMLKLPL